MESINTGIYHRSKITRILSCSILLFILMSILGKIDFIYVIKKVIFDTDIRPDLDTGNALNAEDVTS